jgi:hypothetical protein
MAIQRAAAGFALAAAAVTLTVWAGEKVNIGIEMGLWEVAAHAQTSGAALPPQMQEQLQHMAPEQRARIEAAMQGAMADAQRGHVFRECVTPERLSQGLGKEDESAQCKASVVRNTRTEFEYRKVCSGGSDGAHTEDAVFHMTDPHHISGTVDVVVSGSAQPMQIHQILEGKWVSSSCGDVKDVEQIR